MNIVILSSKYPYMNGGVSDYVYFLSSKLVDSGNNVSVITRSNTNLKIEDSGPKIYPILDGSNIKSHFEIFKTIDLIKPDHINIQYVPYMYSKYGLPFSILLLIIMFKLMKINVSVTFHEISAYNPITKPLLYLVSKIQYLLSMFIAKRADRIIVVIDIHKSILEKWNRNVRTIPLGSSIPLVSIPKTSLNKYKKQLCGRADFVISTFGSDYRLIKQLISFLTTLSDQGYVFNFFVIGKLPDEHIAELSHCVKSNGLTDQIIITGMLSAEDVYIRLSISDLFVLLKPMDDKGYGGVSSKNTTLSTAFSVGLPVIANRGHLTDSNLVHMKNIFLIDDIEKNTLLDAIKLLITDSKLRMQISDNAKRTYETSFDWKVVADKYLETIMTKPV